MLAKNILMKKECPKKAYFSKLNNFKGKNYYMSIILKKFLVENFSTLNNLNNSEKICSFLNKEFENLNLSKHEGDSEKKLLKAQILRYGKWEQNRKIIKKYLKEEVIINNIPIWVEADALIKNNDGTIDIVKYTRKAQNYSYRAIKKSNKPEYSLELYLLQKLGEKILDKDVIVNACIISMKSKKDSSLKLVDMFEVKKGDNVIKTHFENNSEEEKFVLDEFENLIREDYSIKKEGSHCNECNIANMCKYNNNVSKLTLLKEPLKKAGNVKFTIAQKKFINFSNGILRVNAVPGAGKTTVVSNRVINLIKLGYDPEKILLITFSEKGCEELKEKLSFWCNKYEIDASKVSIYTFNAFGNNVISKEYLNLGYLKQPKLLDKHTKYSLIKDILDKSDYIEGFNYRNSYLDMPNAKGALVALNNIFNEFKKNEIETYLDMILFGYDKKFCDTFYPLFEEYQKKLKEECLIEYEDQINLTIKLIKNKEICSKLNFEHIMIDEFQDTNKKQLFIISRLLKNSKFSSLVVCGDDAQSIFSFTGTSQKNIINFHNEFENVEDLNLSDNYRSCSNIVELANKINNFNKLKIDKKIRAFNKELGNIEVKKFNSEDIALKIEKLINSGMKKSEICVIARKRKDLYKIKEQLNLKNIECNLDISKLLIDDCKIKKIISFSRFLLDNSLELNFAEYLQIVKYDEFSNSLDIESFIKKEKDEFIKKYNLEKLSNEELASLFKEELKKMKDVNIEFLLGIIDDITSIIDLVEFLENLILVKSDFVITKEDEKYDAITLTTAHSSKGKEFRTVIGVLDSFKYYNLPNEEDKEFEEKLSLLEEERRLLYVLITRAMDNIIITYEKPNGFINEINESLIDIKENSVC